MPSPFYIDFLMDLIIMKKIIGAAATLFISLIITTAAQAGLVIGGTRVIYDMDQKDVSVHFDNRGETPSLAQVWIDDGNRDTPIDKLNVPFILTPAMSRVEPGKGQTIRIIYTGNNPAMKVEKLYWLNVLDIPGMAKKDRPDNYLQLAIRSRIKLFLRPAGLSSKDMIDSVEKLKWHWNNASGAAKLQVTNASPYYITLTSIALTSASGTSIPLSDTGMVAPNDSRNFTVPKNAVNPTKVTYESLSDAGAGLKFSTDLN